MANFHPLWAPPSEAELEKGTKAIKAAQSIVQKTEKEADYLATITSYYTDWQTVDHRTRCIRFERSMENLVRKYPQEKEASVFYALALTAAADPTDKTYQKQKKAGAILTSLYPSEPNHPGIVHYLIHAYDYPELAELGLPAARKYASVAPSSAHAVHMPSHIFTRLGLWQECIQSNQASLSNAQCYATQAGIEGHWDEELHALDYLTYAYLQKGADDSAQQQWQYLQTIKQVSPLNFKVAYSFAAIPSRIVLEMKRWNEAASLQLHNSSIPWNEYPWQKAIHHFTRLLGAVHTGNKPLANSEHDTLEKLHQTLVQQKNTFQANKVLIQLKAGEAWMLYSEGQKEKAITQIRFAADLEDKFEKHPVTPGDVLPARELLGDLLLQMGKPAEALEAYEASLKKNPARFNGLYGAGLAAEKTGNREKARHYYSSLIEVTGNSHCQRKELVAAKKFLGLENASKMTLLPEK
jgi:tetratricopeptide (TPR) repeat protein